MGDQGGWSVQTEVLGNTTQGNIAAALAKETHQSVNNISLEAVGATWGGQITNKAIEALIGFLIVIVLYLSVAFEARMAAAALVALAHDIVITVGVYALVRFEVSPATVIGLLTILGYSLYDTVVVFDKVRENTAGLLATRRTRYSEAANLALNQTLVRSINTSLIALLPVVAILLIAVSLLGSGELQDLSLVLFVGMLSGTYSSICIATPVLADLKERQSEYKQLAKQIAQRATSSKRQAKVAVGNAAASRAAVADAGFDDAGQVPADQVDDDAADEPQDEADEEITGRVTAARSAGSAAGARPGTGTRQQPRRSTSSQRRSTGSKKKR